MIDNFVPDVPSTPTTPSVPYFPDFRGKKKKRAKEKKGKRENEILRQMILLSTAAERNRLNSNVTEVGMRLTGK